MIHQIVNKWRQILPHGMLEQTGVLLWVMSVMVIGLRLALIIPDQPIFLRVLEFSVWALSWIAVLGGVGASLVAVRYRLYLHAQSTKLSARPRDVGSSRATRWNRLVPAFDSLMLFTIDSLLAATIVRAAIGWAHQARLDSQYLVYLAGLAILHVTLAVLHEHRVRC